MLNVSIVIAEGFSEVRTKTAGMTIAAVARIRVEALVLAAIVLNSCSSLPRPPKKNAVPKIKSRFPIMEPVIDAFTISVSPACREKMLMINSVAFPKVAFNNPPSAGPVYPEISSVDLPINLARGMIASEARIKMTIGEKFIYSANKLSGIKRRRILKTFSSIFVFSKLNNLHCHLVKYYNKVTSNQSFSSYLSMANLRDNYIPQVK